MSELSSFHDLRFPPAISFGATGGPERRNDIVALTSGREKRNARFSQSRHRYDAGTGLRSLDDLHEVMAFFEARRGSLHAFRFRDPFDMKSCRPAETVSALDQVLGEGDGEKARFPLTKTYGEGEDAYRRLVWKPDVSTLQVAVAGAAQASPEDFVFDPATAEQVGAEIWKLSGLLRGQLGTDDAMLAGASSGADFVLLDDAVVPAGLLAGEIGLQLNWRIDGSFIDSLIDNAATEAVGGVRALMPLSPVHLKAHPAGGDVAVSWVRRSRIDADRWEGSDIPLGENAEQYRIEIAPADGAIVRTATTSEPSWLYEAASIAADFATAGEIDVTVRQFSTAVGWGVPARRRFTLP